MSEEVQEWNAIIKSVIPTNAEQEHMGMGVYHLLRGIHGKSLKPGERFRAATLTPISSPNSGQWLYTQIFIDDIPPFLGSDPFELAPKRAVIISENPDNEQLSLTYVLNDIDHVAPPADTFQYFDFDQVVSRAAFFLLRGRRMAMADEIYIAASNGELTDEESN